MTANSFPSMSVVNSNFTNTDLLKGNVFYSEESDRKTAQEIYDEIEKALLKSFTDVRARDASAKTGSVEIKVKNRPNGFVRNTLLTNGFGVTVVSRPVTHCDCDFGCRGGHIGENTLFYLVSWGQK